MRTNTPLGWRVTRYDYINRQLYDGANGLGYLLANPPDLWLSADQGLTQVGARVSDGTSQSISCGFTPALGTNSFTAEIFYLAKSNAAYQYPMGCGAGSTSEGGFSFGKDTSGKIYFSVANTSTLRMIYSGTTNALNTWNHLVGVVDRATSEIRFYLNSTLQGSTPITSLDNFTGLSQLGLGYIRNSTGYSGESLNGAISRARLLIGYAYTQPDVDVTYNNGNGLLGAEMPSSLALYVTDGWNLNEPSGRAINYVTTNHGVVIGSSTEMGSTDGPRESIVADNSGNDYHLKLVNYSADQRVTHWVTDSDGNEYLKFERLSSNYCVSSSVHAFMSTDGFKVGSIAVKFKFQDSATTVTTYQGLASIGTQKVAIAILPPTSNLMFIIRGSSDTFSYTDPGSIINNSTSWYYLLCTFDGNSTDLFTKIYLNGIYNTNTTTPWQTYCGPPLNTEKVYVGRNWGVFGGLIDYVKFFNVALTTSDAVAQAAGSTFAVAPVMDYTFNDGPQESGVSNGDSIAGWKSREGKNYQFNQGTLANRPTWVANATHGQPGIQFDGTNDYLKKDSKTLVGTSGIDFMVVEIQSTATHYFFGQANESTLGFRVGFAFIGSTAGLIQFGHNYNSTLSYFNTSGFNSTNLALLTIGSKNSSGFIRIKNKSYNVTAVISNSWWGSNFSATDLVNTTIGSLLSTAIFYPTKLRYCEHISYDGYLPEDKDILAIERYLLTKYGIST